MKQPVNKLMQSAVLTLVSCMALVGLEPTVAQSNRPNIILVFMDDMGYGDLGTYGSAIHQTPAMDALANTGARFTHFYAAQGVCSASRAALLTGCYPNRIGISGALFPHAPTGLHPEEMTIAEILKTRGYRTAMAGKWHLGDHASLLPGAQGFDQYLGLPYSNDMWPVDYNGKPVDSPHRKAKFPPLPLIRGDRTERFIQTLEDQGMLTRWYTNFAVDFIQHQKKEDPFFLYLAHSMPHVPIYASARFRGKSGKGLYADMMAELDWSLDTLMRTLKARGLYENTLIILTSDNGPWLNFGNHAGNSGGLREGKGTAWEGGVRVPCIMAWPGRIAAGITLNGLATTMDILPTIAAITGAALPSRKIDGLDLSAYITGKKSTSPRETFAYYYDRNNLKGLRWHEWKLVFPARSQTYLIHPPGMDGYPGDYADTSVTAALYNLNWDLGETRDLQKLFPDIVEKMTAMANQFRNTLGDDLTATKGTDNRPAAQIKQ